MATESLVVYQSIDRYLVMVYTDPVHNLTPDPHINSNLLERYNSSNTSQFLDDSLPIGVGFAITFNELAKPPRQPEAGLNNWTTYSRLSVGSNDQLGPGITEIADYFWYNGSGINPPSTNPTVPESGPRGGPEIEGLDSHHR